MNVDLNQTDSMSSDFSCEMHMKKLEAFCSTCMRLLCIDCIIEKAENHKGHEIASIELSAIK
jgi:hypothetical protein